MQNNKVENNTMYDLDHLIKYLKVNIGLCEYIFSSFKTTRQFHLAFMMLKDKEPIVRDLLDDVSEFNTLDDVEKVKWLEAMKDFAEGFDKYNRQNGTGY